MLPDLIPNFFVKYCGIVLSTLLFAIYNVAIKISYFSSDLEQISYLTNS